MVDVSVKLWWWEGSAMVVLRQLLGLVVLVVSGATVIIWVLKMSFATKKQDNVNVTHNSQHSVGSATSANLDFGTFQTVASVSVMDMQTLATLKQENVSTAGTTLLEVSATSAKSVSMEALSLVTTKCLAENVVAQKQEPVVILMPRLVIWMNRACSLSVTVKMVMMVTGVTSARTTSMVTQSSPAESASLVTAPTIGTQQQKEIAMLTLENA